MTPPTRIPIGPDSLLDICDLLGAERFELIGRAVTFDSTRGPAGRSWTGMLGDDLVADGHGFYRIVSTEVWSPLAAWTDAPETFA